MRREWTTVAPLVLGTLAVSAVLAAGVVASPVAVIVALVIAGVLFCAIAFPLWAGLGLYSAAIALLTCLQVLPGAPERAVSLVGGPARFTLVFAVLIAIKGVATRRDARVPMTVGAVIVAGVGLVVMQVVVGALRHEDFSAGIAQLYSDAPTAGVVSQAIRSASYPLAAYIGYASLAMGTVYERRQAARAVSVVALLVFAASIWYWAWARGFPAPGLSSIFREVAAQSAYHGRSIFPFASDSPNGNGLAFAMLVVFAVVLERDRSLGRRNRKWIGALLVVGLFAIITTASRTGLISFLAAMFVVAVLTSRWGPGRTAILAAGLALLVLLATQVVLPSDRSISATAPTLVARTQLWQRAISGFEGSPVIGNGYGYNLSAAFGLAPLPGNRPAYATRQEPPVIQGTQSEYLAQLGNGGVLGFGVFLAPFVIVGRRSMRRGTRGAAALFVGTMIGLAIAAITTTLETSSEVWALMWLMLGMVTALAMQSPQPQSTDLDVPDGLVQSVPGVSH